MRSYYAHLDQVKNSQPLKDSKPIFRASAIFPAIQQEEISTRLLFLSYWLLKRDIEDITCLITLRSQEGAILYRQMDRIHEPKSYRYELKRLMENAELNPLEPFIGSIEIEFFSARPLVYPFPAVTVNYYGKEFCTFVHTAQRIYNDYEDMAANSKKQVPESGFNIYANEKTEPFITFINGPAHHRQVSIECTFINSQNKTLQKEIIISELSPYETFIFYPSREFELEKFLEGKVGTVKIAFSVDWIFPRLIVGNLQNHLPALSITHSYYDCSKASGQSDYWIPPKEGYYPASLSVPVKVEGKAYTNIYFYPIYTPSHLHIDLEVYNSKGELLFEKENVFILRESSGKYTALPIKALLEEVEIHSEESLSAHLIAKTKDNKKIPARLKVALDIGYSDSSCPPSNLCTNLVPYNSEWDNKENTYHWMPLIADQPNCSVWILNNTPHIAHTPETKTELTFYRESDQKNFQRELTIPPNGFLILNPTHDKELRDFLNGEVGWVSVKVSNPYVTTYYFTENPSGAVGGDHGY